MKLTFLFFASAVLLACSVFAAPPVEEGKTIFSARCAGCHNINKVLTGPALAGVDKRRTIDWIVNFVHSSQTVIKKGDATAVELFNKFNHIPMPDHPDLSADNIKNIVEYIKSEATGSNPEKAPFARPSQLRPSYKPLTFANYGFFLSYIALVCLLIGVLIFAVQLKQYQRSAKEKV
ncbi:cytochrome c [Flavisolibacter nicotianae]|uniref:cytochrome c n=1 Tax=Flavisolibacter nicotianae TaxID=2364882 RepID=UPI0013C4B000|nr:cytochrome c [Flavisolibacter nicotianae]